MIGQQPAAGAGLPKGAWNAHLFQIFNTASWSIVLGTPMMLFLKHLGASGTVLGIAAAVNPLFAILQIPAANYVERVGYRRFVLRGWATRSLFIMGIAAMAALPAAVSPVLRTWLALLFLAAFSAARGISVCGLLPWITHLIPEGVRGKFLSRDQTAMYLALLATMLIVSLSGSRGDQQLNFPLLFAASYASALVSLAFLRRIPDVPVPASPRSGARVPWKAMLLHPPFLKLVVFNVLTFIPQAGLGVLWVPLMRDEFGLSDTVMLSMVVVFCGAASLVLMVFGRLVDRVGSRPLLGVAGWCSVIHMLGWAAVAARVVPLNVPVMLVLQVTGALFNALFNLANTRLVMSTVPVQGRSHFFALFSVINNLTLGLLPIVWGAALDLLQGRHARWGGWHWSAFSLLYVVLAGLAAIAQIWRSRLTEPRSMTTEEFMNELLVKTPARALVRLFNRRTV